MAGASLAAENAVLGSIVEDLQLQITQQREGAGEIAELQSTLRQTEDALLDMHDECKTVRASHAQAAEALKVAQRSLGEERKARIVVQQQLRHAGSVQAVTERTMAEEVALLEREWLRETDSGFATQLREAAEDAVKGMHEAQAECRWLYEQLQTLLAGGTIAPAARAAAEHPRFPPPMPAGPAVATSGESAHSLDAMRGAYTKAVQRCHQLQVHAASADELDAPRRAELVAARERIAALQAELDVREAADTRRVLASERAWVAALDEMRLDDLRTIQQLERKLQAWQQRFEPPSQSG